MHFHEAIDLPQIDLTRFPGENERAKRDFSYAKWMSERRSRERSICLACKVVIGVSRQKRMTSFVSPALDGAVRRKQSNMFVSTKSKEEIC